MAGSASVAVAEHRHPLATQKAHHRMPVRSIVTRTGSIALAAAALAAPTASARPA